MNTLKLYAFKPKGHGEYSFFVMAENEEQAREYVNIHISKIPFENGKIPYEYDSFSTEGSLHNYGKPNYYECTVYQQGEVAENEND